MTAKVAAIESGSGAVGGDDGKDGAVDSTGDGAAGEGESGEED